MLFPLKRLFSRRGLADCETGSSAAPAEAGIPGTSPAARAAASVLTRRASDPLRTQNADRQDCGDAPDDRDVLARIAVAMDEVRPAIRMDGGDIELIGFSEGTATVRLKGACRSCPMSEMTLQLGVERVLRELVPEVERVESI